MKNQEQQFIFNHISPIIIAVMVTISTISIVGIIFPFIFNVLQFYGALYPNNFTVSSSYRLISYGLLHQDYGHLGMNMVWLLIFATPIQRFFGTKSFLIIFIMGIIIGGAILLTYDNHVVVIGASAGVSACVGASLRFMLKPSFDFQKRPQIYKLTDGRFLLPTILFFVFDIISAFLMTNAGNHIAWQSHIIGYITGALLMELKYINHGAMKRDKLHAFEQRYLGD